MAPSVGAAARLLAGPPARPPATKGHGETRRPVLPASLGPHGVTPLTSKRGAAPSASTGAAQFTMLALILAFGIALLFWGPVADRMGRWPALLDGTLLTALLTARVAWTLVWRLAPGTSR